LSQEESEKASDDRRFYNVDRFRDVVDPKASVVPPKGFRSFLAGLGAVVDSISGLLSALAGMLVVFVSPVIVIVGALHGLVWFVVTFLGVLGGPGFTLSVGWEPPCSSATTTLRGGLELNS